VFKIAPITKKVPGPVAEHAVDNGTKIELCTENVEHGAVVDSWGGKRSLVDLEPVSVLGGLHGGIDDWVELDCLSIWTGSRGQGMNI
jgi:hypothetical protein